MSTSSNGTTEDSSQQFTKSIEEIDRRLKCMDERKPTIDMTIKDPSVYEHKADSWLRHHLNTIKQNRRASDAENVCPVGNEFQMKRGYTADLIERRPKEKNQEKFLTPKLDRKSKSM